MHPADAPGGKDLDPGQFGGDHGCGDRGGPGAALRHAHGHVGAAQFGDIAGPCQPIQFSIGESNVQLPFQDRDRGGNRTFIADCLFHLPGCLEVAGPGHAMGDDGAFKGHDRAARVQRRGHFWGMGVEHHDGISPET